MIVALNSDLERTHITKRMPGDHFFCPVCGDHVYPTAISEPFPKKRRRKRDPVYQPLIPLEKQMEFFAHRKRPCYRPFEIESVEHIIMKTRIANEFHELKPIIDHPLGNRIIDIFIPSLNLAIECQSSQITGHNVESLIRHHSKYEVLTTFIWGHRIFSRIKDSDEKIEYYKLRATVAEDTILSEVPIHDDDGHIRDLVDDSEEARFEPRSYVYFEQNKLYWLHVFRKKDRLYFGTKHSFKGANVQLYDIESDIGNIVLFQRRKTLV